MSYMSRNPQVASVVLDDITTTTPGNPPAGKHKIVDRMGNIFVRNSSGAETIIASAAGNSDGEKNYITNPSGAASISGWANVGDLDIVRTATAAELPREFSTKTGLKITADANAQTVADYVYFDFSIDDVDMSGQVMKIKWDQKLTGTYTAGQLAVVITTQADRTTAVSTPFTSAIPASDGTFQTYFLAPATATCSLVIRCTGEMATDGGIVISDVVVGPNVQVQGAAIGAWKAFTPTGSWSANTTYTGFYREVGEDVEINVNIALAGAPTSAALTVNMPTGFTINSSKMATTTSAAILGLVSIYDAAPATYEGRILYSSTSAVAVVVEKSDGTYGAYVAVTEAVPQTFANGDKVQLSYKVPVNELSSNVTLANRAVEEYASNSDTTDADITASGFVTGPSGSTTPTTLSTTRSKRVRFQTARQSTDVLIAEIGPTATGPWMDAGLLNDVGGITVEPYGHTVGFGQIRPVGGSLTDFDVFFRRYRTATSDWATTNGFWRIRKVSSGASVGYPISSANIVGRTDGVAPASGMVGHYQEVIGSATSLTNGQFSDGGSAGLALGAGTYDLQATVIFDNNPATTITGLLAAIGTASGNSSTGIDSSRNKTVVALKSTQTLDAGPVLVTPIWRVTVAAGATVTYYPKAYSDFAVNAMTALGSIFSRRVA